MKRLLCVFLALSILLVLLSSCGKGNNVIIVTPDDETETLSENDLPAEKENEDGEDSVTFSVPGLDDVSETVSDNDESDLSTADTVQTISISLVAKGVSGYPKTITAEKGDKVSLPSPKKSGYSFTGWFDSETGGREYKSGNSFSGNKTLYAGWKADTHTVTLMSKGSVYDTIKAEHGSTVTLPTPSESGFKFSGWYTPDNKLFTSSDKVNKDITLTAEWNRNTYTVSFDSNGGSPSYEPMKVAHGSTINLLSPSRNGYSFDGWYTSGGTRYTSSTPITENVNLYARWSAETYTVSFDSNGGSPSYNSMSVSYGSTINMPSPSKEGYTFEGWYTSGGTRYTSSTKITESVYLYARWRAKTYTVSFDSNGGSPSYNSMNVPYGSTINLPSPSRNGYSFDGWYTSGGTRYTSSTKITGNVTLYAHWKADTYTVSFNSNGGTPTYNSVKVPYGSTINLSSPTRQGYKFEGWYTSSGTKFTSSTKVTENVTLTAKWTQNPESDWSDSVPAGATKTQTRTVYRYRTRSTEPVYTSKTQYQYGYYACNRCGVRWYGPCYHSSLGSSCPGYITGPNNSNAPYTAWFDFAPLTGASWRVRTGDSTVYSFNNGSGDYFYTNNRNTLLYNYMNTKTVNVQTGTRYTDWSAWSSWSTTNPGSKTETRDVASKEQYKYRYN